MLAACIFTSSKRDSELGPRSITASRIPFIYILIISKSCSSSFQMPIRSSRVSSLPADVSGLLFFFGSFSIVFFV